jgi:tetratricopeptide (TPR) repeat protein
MIDEKLARELYRPLASPPVENKEPQNPKIPIHRFQALEQIIKNNPASPQPYVELATFYIDGDQWRNAKRVLEQGVLHNAEDETIISLFEDVRLRLSRNAMDAAARKYQQLGGEVDRRELDQSELELAALQFEVSEARFLRHPHQYDLLVMSAIALRRLGRVDEAISRLEHAQHFPACRASASLHLGNCLESQSRVIEALAAYRCAALFRSPPPALDIKLRALDAAANLSEKSLLWDSAIRYLSMLVEESNEGREERIQKIAELKSLAIQQRTVQQNHATED